MTAPQDHLIPRSSRRKAELRLFLGHSGAATLHWLCLCIIILFSQSLSAHAQNFFTVERIKRHTKPPKDNVGVWRVEKGPNGRLIASDFIECIEVSCIAKENIASKDVYVRAYYYDENNKLLFKQNQPSKSGTKQIPRSQHATPVIFKAGVTNRIFFEVPEQLSSQKWKMLIVFGDKHEVGTATFPQHLNLLSLEFPEKNLTQHKGDRSVKRNLIKESVIEHVVRTQNPKHPQITLFLRPPKGVKDWSEVKGVYALVVLANSVEDIRRRMEAVELDGDEAGTFAFANKHKLAILVWGSRSIWNARMNFDDYQRAEARELDRNFDLVANAWERAVQYFHRQYGLPTENFILRGNCGAAQWAKRLCLRKPQYFLAAHIHLAGSYDRPTPEASKVLWCVTTTEIDGGYERSLRFLTACREAGYPIVYKAYSPQSRTKDLGGQFFEYAMTFKEQRKQHDQQTSDPLKQLRGSINDERVTQPWPESFRNPPFYGDVVNQELFPAKELEMIPEGFRTGIPTARLADFWKD